MPRSWRDGSSSRANRSSGGNSQRWISCSGRDNYVNPGSQALLGNHFLEALLRDAVAQNNSDLFARRKVNLRDSNQQTAEVALTGQTIDSALIEGSDDMNLFLSGKALRDFLDELFG